MSFLLPPTGPRPQTLSVYVEKSLFFEKLLIKMTAQVNAVLPIGPIIHANDLPKTTPVVPVASWDSLSLYGIMQKPGSIRMANPPSFKGTEFS